ncbi:MAG: glutamate--tRNA ligase [Desulfurococcales archaeon]|nr:glutamate--tRNA ligase [Desulfurococcales archaeon]
MSKYSREEIERITWAYALKNALDHDGKAQVKSVISKLIAEKKELKAYIREIIPIIRQVVEQVNNLSIEEQERMFESYAELVKEKEKQGKKTLPPLPGAEPGKVKTRFAPNPDFVIHLGNARPAILSHEYARMYKGKFILRFEDTDPRTKSPLGDVYSLIKEDLNWLGIDWDEEYIQSKRLPIYYEIARKLIRKGGAYIDTCPREVSRELIVKGRACPTRDNPIEWHLEQFEKMVEGEYGEGEAVLRVKTDLSHPDLSVRDWVAIRIIDTTKYPHPIVGSKYFAWPTYNFAVSIDDYMMGVTHILRGKEHQQNTLKQMYLFDHLEWKYPIAIHFGRLHLEDFIMSKSLIRKLLSENPDKFWGYDDPRFGTIRGLRRRGILPEAIRQLILEVGIKGTDSRVSFSNLAAINRKLLDEKAHRIMFVSNPLKVQVTGFDEIIAKIPVHPSIKVHRVYKVRSGSEIWINKDDLGHKQLRLIGLGNFEVDGKRLTFIGNDVSYAKKNKLPIIQWVPAESSVETRVYKPIGLEFEVEEGLAEPGLLEYKPGDQLQFIRYGFIRIDTLEKPRVNVVFSHE